MTNDQYTVIKSREAKERRQQMESGRMQAGVVSIHASELQALRESNADLIAALQDLINPRFDQAYRDGEYWAVQAKTAARAALAKAGAL